ncbi:CoA transferase [Caulobacter segnis]
MLPGIAPSNVSSNQERRCSRPDRLQPRHPVQAAVRPDGAAWTWPRTSAIATMPARGAHQHELDARIAAWTADQDIDALLPRLEAAGLATGRIYRAPDMLKDPQFAARESIVTVAHPVFGQIKMQNAFPSSRRRPAA